jgi:hypothetical protein
VLLMLSQQGQAYRIDCEHLQGLCLRHPANLDVDFVRQSRSL